MFGRLKEKLKAIIEKVSSKLEKKEDAGIEEKPGEKEQAIEEKKDLIEEIEKEDEKIVQEIVKAEEKLDKVEELLKEDVKEKGKFEKKEEQQKQEKKEVMEVDDLIKEEEKLIEKIEEEKLELKEVKGKILEDRKKFEKTGEPKKPASFLKRVTEKTLAENDIRDVLESIKHALLENDVALEVAERICIDVQNNMVGKAVKRGKAKEVVESALKAAVFDVLSQKKIDLDELVKEKQGPLLVVFLGFNGSGKTTTLARMAYKYKKYKPVLAAGDTFRAASIEQLEEHAKNLKLDIVKHRYGADSAAVIFDAKNHAGAKGSMLVLADTAGRSHANINLMDELKKVCRVNKPDLKVLVLDALTGNDIYEQAKRFDEAVGVDAVMLTKTDVYEKGGAALSAAYTIKKPIMFLGTGQNYSDLEEFDPEKIVKNLLG